MKRNLLLAAALLIPVIIAGCLVSGTIVFVFDLEGLGAVGSGMKMQYVDLTTNSDYNDNKDKLKSVDAVVLVGDIINLGNAADSAEVFISDDSLATAGEVRANATKIFVSPSLAAHDTVRLDWSDGMAHMRNLDAIESQLKGDGQFYIYGITNSNLAVQYALNLIVTITAGL